MPIPFHAPTQPQPLAIYQGNNFFSFSRWDYFYVQIISYRSNVVMVDIGDMDGCRPLPDGYSRWGRGGKLYSMILKYLFMETFDNLHFAGTRWRRCFPVQA